MADNTQSRYSIIENLNQQKLKLKTAMANFEQQKCRAEQEHANTETRLLKDIADIENYGETEHKHAITLKKIQLQEIDRQFREQIEKVKSEMAYENENYKELNKKRESELLLRLDNIRSNYKQEQKLNDINYKAMMEQLKNIDDAIKDLKEISKEQK